MKIDCSLCVFSKHISSHKVLEKHCNSCKEKNYIFYKPELLNIKDVLGYDIADVNWRQV